MTLPIARLTGPTLLVVIAVTLWALGENVTASLAASRNEITAGQWWRLLSGNFLHTNTYHLLLNLSGFSLIWALHYRYYAFQVFVPLVIVLCLGTTLGVYLFSPSLTWYVGLSGMLHGLCVWGAWRDIQSGFRTGWLLLVGVVVKVIHEQMSGADPMVADLIDARVAVDAHLYGALSAFAVVAFWIFFPAMKNHQRPE